MAALIIGLVVVGWLKHRYGWSGAAVRIVPVFLAMNVLSLTVYQGSVLRLRHLLRLRREFRGAPDDVLLTCQGREVSVVTYDADLDLEGLHLLYTGSPSWRGGPRLAAKVRRSVSRQLTIRALIFLLVALPMLGYSLWAGLFVNWVWLMVAVVVLTDQLVLIVLLPSSMVAVLEELFDQL